MEKLSFLKQFLANPRNVGAIFPSSKYLAEKMVKDIDFKQSSYIIEYGPGTGIFTEKLLANRKQDTKMLIIEKNQDFYKILSDKYKNIKNLQVINGSAVNVDQYMKEYNFPYVDYIISGLPFASLPQEISEGILDTTRRVLKENGRFITFQYTLMKREFIGQYFEQIDICRELRNIPPAYVFSCPKKL